MRVVMRMDSSVEQVLITDSVLCRTRCRVNLQRWFTRSRSAVLTFVNKLSGLTRYRRRYWPILIFLNYW